VQRQEPYEDIPYEAEIVTNRILAIAQLIEVLNDTKDAQCDVVALRKLVMGLLLEDAVEPAKADSEPVDIDNSDIE
jgi:hypothetical protein